jgi:hypothetical protein
MIAAPPTAKTVSSLFTALRTAQPAIPRGSVATVPSERSALKAWFIRYFGAGSAAYKAKLEKDPDFTYCSPNILGKFRTARTRILRLRQHGTLSASQGAPFVEFMRWWKGCERDGYAAWCPQVVPSLPVGWMPRAAYIYWRSRYYRAAGTAPVTTIGQVGQAVERERIARLMEASKATMIRPPQVINPLTSAVPELAPTGFAMPTPTATQPVYDPGMRLSMKGMGTWTDAIRDIGAQVSAPPRIHIACPSSSLKNTLFAFRTVVPVAPGVPVPRPTMPPPTVAPAVFQQVRIRPVAEAVAIAAEQARTELARRRLMEQLEEQVAGLRAQLSAATSAGASDQIAALQAQVESLTASLASAQQDHVGAANAAASAYRDEVASLQAQIATLNDAMAASTNNSEVAGLRAQVEALMGQLAAAEVAADESAEAAAESEAAYQATASWFERNKTNLLIGAGVLAAGVVGWKVLQGRKAMHLPPPTSKASPSGLARNPGRRKSYFRRAYSYLRKGKRVKVPAHYVGR